MLRYEHAVEFRRRPWQRRIEVYSPKLQRRLTLFSRELHDAWLLLEADSQVRSFCERPGYVAGEAGRLLDFWVDNGRHAKFWVLCSNETVPDAFPKRLHGIALRLIRRVDMIAAAMRIRNWAQIVPYLTSFARHSDRRLQEEIYARLNRPHRLGGLESAFNPIDVSVIRAALFRLLAEGKVASADLDTLPLGLNTIFKQVA